MVVNESEALRPLLFCLNYTACLPVTFKTTFNLACLTTGQPAYLRIHHYTHSTTVD